MGGGAWCQLYASASVAARATPDVFVGLITTAEVRSNSVARRKAASRSIRLLYDNSFPWSFSAVAVAANGNGSRYKAAFWYGFSPYRRSVTLSYARRSAGGSTFPWRFAR